MDNKKTRKLTISAMVIALYLVVLYITQSFSFGAYQIRIATSFYALAYIHPFLILPLGVANLIANMLFGGLGILDMIGGALVGIVATSLIYGVRKYGLSIWYIALPIWLVPSLAVPLWLSYLLHLPYTVLVVNLLVGQAIPAIVGVLLVQVLERTLVPQKGLISHD